MHISLASAFRYPDGGPGAIRTLALAHGLAELGHTVTFILVGNATADVMDTHPAITFVQCSRRSSQRSPASWRLSLVRGFAETLKKVNAENMVDGLLIVNRDSWILNRCRSAAQRLGIPAIHELTEFLQFTPTAGVRNLIERKLLLRELRRLPGVLAISTALKDFLTSEGVSQVLVTGPCLDARGWETPGLAVPSDILRIGYSGSLNQVKDGVLDLLTAVDLVRQRLSGLNVRLELVGGSPSDLARAVRYANELSMKDQVNFHGPVEPSAVPAILGRCHVLVMPRPRSRQAEGGFPTKLGEYLATGRPVIATTVGDVPRYLTTGVDCILIEPGDPTSLAESIASVAENYNNAQEIGQAGQRTATSVFRSTRAAEIVVELIEGFQKVPNDQVPNRV